MTRNTESILILQYILSNIKDVSEIHLPIPYKAKTTGVTWELVTGDKSIVFKNSLKQTLIFDSFNVNSLIKSKKLTKTTKLDFNISTRKGNNIVFISNKLVVEMNINELGMNLFLFKTYFVDILNQIKTIDELGEFPIPNNIQGSDKIIWTYVGESRDSKDLVFENNFNQKLYFDISSIVKNYRYNPNEKVTFKLTRKLKDGLAMFVTNNKCVAKIEYEPTNKQKGDTELTMILDVIIALPDFIKANEGEISYNIRNNLLSFIKSKIKYVKDVRIIKEEFGPVKEMTVKVDKWIQDAGKAFVEDMLEETFGILGKYVSHKVFNKEEKEDPRADKGYQNPIGSDKKLAKTNRTEDVKKLKENLAGNKEEHAKIYMFHIVAKGKSIEVMAKDYAFAKPFIESQLEDGSITLKAFSERSTFAKSLSNLLGLNEVSTLSNYHGVVLVADFLSEKSK